MSLGALGTSRELRGSCTHAGSKGEGGEMKLEVVRWIKRGAAGGLHGWLWG